MYILIYTFKYMYLYTCIYIYTSLYIKCVYIVYRAPLVAQLVKNAPAMQET